MPFYTLDQTAISHADIQRLIDYLQEGRNIANEIADKLAQMSDQDVTAFYGATNPDVLEFRTAVTGAQSALAAASITDLIHQWG